MGGNLDRRQFGQVAAGAGAVALGVEGLPSTAKAAALTGEELAEAEKGITRSPDGKK